MDIMMSMADTFLVAELDEKKNMWWKVKTRDNSSGKEFHTFVSPDHFPFLLALMVGASDFDCPPIIYTGLEKAFIGAEGGCRPLP